MKIGFVSSYIPRKCGLATYTKDLSSEIKNQQIQIAVIAMDDGNEYKYSSPVIQKIRQNTLADYTKIAEHINNSNIDIIHLQHEFGLFGGENGEYILSFARALRKPLITTFHTVLLTPTEKQKYIIQELTRISRKVIVMQEIARDRLDHVYGLNPWDIDVIYHGVPEISKLSKDQAKKQLGFKNSFILLANNLLSRNKGIEYAIEAIAQVKKQVPNILFLIAGETHPSVKKFEGESYRRELESKVKKLHLEKNVIFINEYVPLEKLVKLLATADIYITPYLDPQQITSGTLSNAIGAGKMCIATEYVYAENMLSDGKGILVPFRDSPAIANAIVDIASHPKKRMEMEKKAYVLGKRMRWPKVARSHAQLYKQILTNELNRDKKIHTFLQKKVNISYLSYLTDEIGIIQHGKFSLPDKRFGYSTDDVARGLIVAANVYKKAKQKKVLALTTKYLHFLQSAQEKNGMFHNFLSFDRKWEDVEDIADTFGKALWGLGSYLHADTSSQLSHTAQHLFSQSIEHLGSLRDLHAAAYASLGMYYYYLSYGKKTDVAKQAKEKLQKLADFIIDCFKINHSKDWDWFKNVVTYDNFRLPQALFASYVITKDEKNRKIAENSLAFLTDISFDKDRGYFDFVGQDGWYVRNGEKSVYDQQPLEAAGAVDTYALAYQVTGKEKYKKYALLSYSWFFGNNRNHRYLLDEQTKGIFDGLTSRGVNENEGAESIVCFLIATNSLQELLFNLKKT